MDVTSRLHALSAKIRTAYEHLDYETMLTHAREAEEVALGSGNIRSVLDYIFSQMTIQTEMGANTEVCHLVARGLPFALQIHDTEYLTKLHLYRAMSQLRMGVSLDLVSDELALASSFVVQTTSHGLQAHVKLETGIVFMLRGEWLAALECADGVLTLEASPKMNARALQQIGFIRTVVGDYHGAEQLFQKSLGIVKHSGATRQIEDLAISIGACQLNQGAFTKALELFESVFPSENILAVCQAHCCAGKCYIKLGHYSEARRHLERCLSIAEVHETICQANILLARTAVREGDPTASIKILLPLRDTIDNEAQYLRAEFFEALHEAYDSTGDLSRAYECLKRKTEITDELHKTQLGLRLEITSRELALANDRLEKEKQRVRAEKLEQELTSRALQVAAQAELLNSVRTDLAEVVQHSNIPQDTLKKLYDRLKTLPYKSVDWKKFDTQFRAVHPEFVQSLTDLHPELTAGDIRMCSLIRMQMKSEDIARLLCLSDRSIESNRFRLRKRLKLERSIDLGVYLARL